MKKKKRVEYHLRGLWKKWHRVGTCEERLCPQCGKKGLIFLYVYDAVCCIKCDTWLSGKCSDPQCPFCSRRPEPPSAVLFFQNDVLTKTDKEWFRNNYQHKVNGQIKHRHRKETYNRILYNKELLRSKI